MFEVIRLETFLYIDLLSETIDYVYHRYLTNNFLNEDYKPLDINAQNFKASILTALYEYNHNNDKSENKLINLLNEKFEKINMSFKKSNAQNAKYPTSGIVRADCYDSGDIIVQINQMFFDILINTPIDGTPTNRLNILIEDLFKIYGHEYTHRCQFNVSNNNLKGLNINTLNDIKETKSYLSNPQEIDAHAREAAIELLLSGMTISDIKSLFNMSENNEKLAHVSKTFAKYWYLFAKKPYSEIEIKPTDIKTFNSFKQNIYKFLELDSNNINKQDLIKLIRSKTNI